MNRKTIVAANWKMNGNHKSVKSFATKLSSVDAGKVSVFFAPPSAYLHSAVEAKHASNGTWFVTAQCGHYEETGAFTGANSMAMLKDIGCDAVLVGHSERREYQGETDSDCLKQVQSALKHDLTPILCIGESDEQNQAGKTEDILIEQLSGVLETLSEEELAKVVIAYEPIWAIGTGRSAQPEDAEKIHQIIRRQITNKHDRISPLISVLYGGSVKPDNANELFSQENIDGGLVGGASLELDSFSALIEIASKIT